MTINIEELTYMDFSDVSDGTRLAPIHPGEILLEEFLKPLDISQYRLAKDIGVQQRRIGEIIAGTRAITIDTGLRLSRYFGMSDGFWSGLQLNYDTEMAKYKLAPELEKIHRAEPVAA